MINNQCTCHYKFYKKSY